MPRWRRDMSRTLAFSTFGAFYLGLFCCWKYGYFYTQLFGRAATVAAISSKVAMDMLISAPFVYFPCYFLMRGLFAGQSPLDALRDCFSGTGLALLRTCTRPVPIAIPTAVPSSCQLILPAHPGEASHRVAVARVVLGAGRYWCVWLPVETVMWVAVPTHLRVAFLCACSLMWQVALSTLSNRPQTTAVDHAEAPTEAHNDYAQLTSRHEHSRAPPPSQHQRHVQLGGVEGSAATLSPHFARAHEQPPAEVEAEVAAEVGVLSRNGIDQGDASSTLQGQILGNLNSCTSTTNDQNTHLN